MKNAERGQTVRGILSSFRILYFALVIQMAARVGLAPTPNGLTSRRATLTPPGT
jgi:hypothetical protein